MQRTATTLPAESEAGFQRRGCNWSGCSGDGSQRLCSATLSLTVTQLESSPPHLATSLPSQDISECLFRFQGPRSLARLLCTPPSFVSSECSLPRHVVCSPPICPPLCHASHVRLLVLGGTLLDWLSRRAEISEQLLQSSFMNQFPLSLCCHFQARAPFLCDMATKDHSQV